MTKMDINYLGQLHTRCTHPESGAVIETDAPKDNQGLGEAFSPTDLFAVSLGSCMITVMGIAAKCMGVELTDLNATVEKEMVTSPVRRVGKIAVHMVCATAFESGIQKKLERAALSCPVHHSLHPDIDLEITFAWGNS